MDIIKTYYKRLTLVTLVVVLMGSLIISRFVKQDKVATIKDADPHAPCKAGATGIGSGMPDPTYETCSTNTCSYNQDICDINHSKGYDCTEGQTWSCHCCIITHNTCSYGTCAWICE